MSNHTKTAIALMVVVALASCALVMSTETDAEETVVADPSKLEYTITDGTATITGYDGTLSGSLTIPDTISGYKVTSIGESAFEGCSGLTSISIPLSGVTSIGASAFEGCSGMSSIQIPSSVTSIEASAFKGCTNITVNKGGVLYIVDNSGSLISASFSVDGKGFDNPNDAIDAVSGSTNKTVKLLKSMTINKDQGIVIEEGENIVLDLGVYTLTVGKGFEGWVITNNGTLEITGNGTITDPGIVECYGLIQNSGTLTIQNGEFTSMQTGTYSKTLVKVISGTVIINGGHFSITDDNGGFPDSMLIDIDESPSGTASVNINGGTFSSDNLEGTYKEGFALFKTEDGYTVREAVTVTIDGTKYKVAKGSTLEGSGFNPTADGFVVVWIIGDEKYTGELIMDKIFDKDTEMTSEVTIVAPSVTVSGSDMSVSGTGVVLKANVTNAFSFEVSYQWSFNENVRAYYKMSGTEAI